MFDTHKKIRSRSIGSKKKQPLRTGQIRGWVMNSAGEPLEEVNVAIAAGPSHLDIAAVTDSTGEFSLGSLQPGEYIVRAVSSDALESDDITVEVLPDKIAVVEIWLE